MMKTKKKKNKKKKKTNIMNTKQHVVMAVLGLSGGRGLPLHPKPKTPKPETT